jgi:hypothetical protein
MRIFFLLDFRSVQPMPGWHELLESAQEQPWNQVHPGLDKDKSPHGECVEM